MDPATWAAIGSIAGAGIGAFGQQSANKKGQEMAREQMAFQQRMAHSAQDFAERMSSSAVQRSVADYQAAGLNPALAYERSASSPTGVMAGGAASTPQNIMKDAPNVAANALATKLAHRQVTLARAQEYKTMQDADLATQQKYAVQRDNRFQEEVVQPAETRRMLLQNQMLGLQIPGMKNSAEMEKKLEQLGGSSSARLFFEFMRMMRGNVSR